MKEAMETDRDKELYKKRKTTVEPVFGILKGVLGFRAPRTPHPSGQSPAMALSLRHLEHPSSPVLSQNLKRYRLLVREKIQAYVPPYFTREDTSSFSGNMDTIPSPEYNLPALYKTHRSIISRRIRKQAAQF